MPPARRIGALLALLLLLLAACQTAQVPEVEGVRFAAPLVTARERAAQIERAAAGLGWRTERLGPGQIRASLGDGLMVLIVFDAASFAIRPAQGGDSGIPAGQRAPVALLRDAIVAQSGV